ncbi:MAG TPA: Nif3-like dinuclear metal center hexameric protein [Phycisphaerae bacterium]|nr:Nif3-like dinuclear metal center hexameric protein [Phycisphaerae bacterium]HRY68658.1 Nif3-like dinuclear metal center hexameric protein [Phycisphaerae bacterium]HSA25484.1 Nif3-like dinuclear metal center hexameric protein [Phycisphaerae bacterium]
MPKPSRNKITVGHVADAMDHIAPPHLAQSWDNVGLLAGDPAAPCRSILLCIDLTPPVLQEAAAAKCGLVLAYHPPLFRPVSRLRADSAGADAVVHRAIAAGIAIYSPHTALDAAPGGTNDVMADLCGLSDVEPFEYTTPAGTQSKVVTFVPARDVDHVAAAMSAAGAGRIGDYVMCSYRIPGEGTFYGTETTSPRVGRRGRLEKVPEVRIEMVAPNHRLPEVVDALLRSHPYEEPAYDIYPLAPAPSFGIGRVGQLPSRTTPATLARKLKKATGSRIGTIVGPSNAVVARAAVCVGSAGMLPFEKTRSADCDIIVTGEIRHHDALMILRMGKSAIALGHWESERPVLASLAERLTRMMPGLPVRTSRDCRPPFELI